MPQADEQAAYEELRRRANRISSLIVASDYPAIDVVIEIGKLKGYAEEQFPSRMGLFRRVYESRFRRLWEQFRTREGNLPEW